MKKTIGPADIFKIDQTLPRADILKLLADDSDGSTANVSNILSNKDFQPQSFTVGDRQDNLVHLDKSESNFDEWCRAMIRNQLKKISGSINLELNDYQGVLKAVRANLDCFLNLTFNGGKIKYLIWNQEFVDIVSNVIKFSLFGDIRIDIDTHEKYNNFARKLIPAFIRSKRIDRLDCLGILKISLASGLSALDLKGAHAASSSFYSAGIPLADYSAKPIEETIEFYDREIRLRAEAPAPIFHWDKFLELIRSKENFKLAWFTDDYIETYFDLLFLRKLMAEHENLQVTLIPKNGKYGTDTSWTDIYDHFLKLDFLDDIDTYLQNGRMSVCKEGPRMGTANIFKLSGSMVRVIEESDLLIFKGCRIPEMLQGGINRPSFSAYVIVREMSERIAGLSAESSPLIFSYLPANRYYFFGIKNKARRTKVFPSGREITVCESTIQEFYKRIEISDPLRIVDEVNALLEKRENLYTDLIPVYQEANELSEELVEITKKTYNNLCQKYKKIRWAEPHELDLKMWNSLLAAVKGRTGKLSLLDIGTGSGRDIKFASRELGLDVVGIDNSEGFIEILKELETEGQVPAGSYRWADMRDLSCFPESTFDIVRHNASLLHLPVIAGGYMADLALAESHRVLKENGILFVFVKEGEGLQVLDTSEGLGGRVFQFHTMQSIRDLVVRNNFSILSITREIEDRKGVEIPWVAVIARKN